MLKYSRIHLHETLVEWIDNHELDVDYTSAEIRQCLKGETAIVQGKRATLLHKRRSLQECGDQDDSEHYLSQKLQLSDPKGQNGDTTRVFKMTFGARSVAPQKPSSSGYHRSRNKHEHSLNLLRCSILHYFCVKHHFYCVPSAQTHPEGGKAPTDGYQADESDTNDTYFEACGDTEDCKVHRGYMELLIRKLHENPSKLDGPLKTQKYTAKTCTGGYDGGNNNYSHNQASHQRNAHRGKSRRSIMIELSMIGHGGSESEPSGNEHITTDTSVHLLHPEETEEEEPSTTESDAQQKSKALARSSKDKKPSKAMPSKPPGASPENPPDSQTNNHRAFLLKSFALSTWKTKPDEDILTPKDAPTPEPQAKPTPPPVKTKAKPPPTIKKPQTVPHPDAVLPAAVPIPVRSEEPHVEDYAFELDRRASVLTAMSLMSKKKATKVIQPEPIPTPLSSRDSVVAVPLAPVVPLENKKKKSSADRKSSFEESYMDWQSATHGETSYLTKASFSTESGIVLKKSGSFPVISKSFQSIVGSVAQVEKWKHEKDNEWLQLSEDETLESNLNLWDLVTSSSPKTESEVEQFLFCQRWLVMAMTIFGVYPYTHVVTSGKNVRVIWARKSFNAVMFFGFTILCGVVLSSMIWSMLRKFRNNIFDPTEEIVYDTEFQKYFVEVLWLMLTLTFLTIWSVTVLSEMGRQQAEFMTRLFYSINLLKYSVSDKIFAIIRNRLCVLASVILVTGVLVLFGGDVIRTPREACGFIALLILGPTEDKLEILGYFVFVWVHTSMSLVLLHFVVVARALKNMARMFNLRLAYRLGKISLDKLDPKEANIVRNIPFEKLHAERLVIASLIKQMGYTHCVAINLYIFIGGAEMILFLYGNTRDRNTTLNTNSTVTLNENGSETVLKNLVYIVYFLYGSFLFINSLNQVGYVFGIGKDYIRKYGLVHCKSASERRFILSMLNLNNPKLTHFIGIRLPINRRLIMGMITVIGFFWAIFMLYSPVRLEAKHYTECNSDGDCSVIHYPKGLWRHPMFLTPPQPPLQMEVTLPQTTPTSTPLPPPITSPPPKVSLVLELPPNWLHNETYPNPTNLRDGSFPPYHIFQALNYSTSIDKRSIVFAIPNVFKRHNRSGHIYSEMLRRELKNTSGAVIPPLGPSPCLETDIYTPIDVQNDIRANKTKFFSGDMKKPLTADQFDDCGNPRASFFTGKKAEDPSTALISTDTLPGGKIGSELYLCCYQYRRDSGTKRAYKYCNMPNLDVLHAHCNETTNVKGLHFVNILKKLRRKKLPHKDVLNDSIIRIVFKDCICRERDVSIKPDRYDTTCESYRV